MHDEDPTTISETAGRLRISVARLARLLRRQNVDSLGATLDAALASLDREGPLTLGGWPPSSTRPAQRDPHRHQAGGRRPRRGAGSTATTGALPLELTPEGRRHVVDNRANT